ncbi:glutathione S-transferase N-terminal domain-containing protein [Alphaproteobacteria bacterium]|nr:glutathione S-transferase N-terminal domain-containing protein [Alphaproteobacteria bacterium]
MKLLSATPSPYARKVRIALAEKGLDFELVTEVPWNEGTSTPAYNPLEKLPVLILDDGGTVFESDFILEWLEAKYPTFALLPADPDQRLAARRFEVVADGVCDAFVLYFFETMREASKQSQPWMDRQMRKIDGGVADLANHVPADGFCVGDQFTIADIAVGTVMLYLDVRFPDYNWRAAHPALAAAVDRLATRPSFAATKPVPQAIAASVI